MNLKNKLSKKSGFTLIEILVVIGLVAILATIVLIAINPARQFAQGRNSQRTSNVNAILNAIGQRIADNKGLFPVATGCPALTASTVYTIGVGASAVTAVSPATVFIDMSCLVPTYIATSLPVDPNGVWNSATDYNTRYNVTVDSVGRFTVCSEDANETVLGSPGHTCITR